MKKDDDPKSFHLMNDIGQKQEESPGIVKWLNLSTFDGRRSDVALKFLY